MKGGILTVAEVAHRPPGNPAGRSSRRLPRPPTGQGNHHRQIAEVRVADRDCKGLRIRPAGRPLREPPWNSGLPTRQPKAWGPRTRNVYRAARWLFATGASRRTGSYQPAWLSLAKANEKADRRRQRRALTEAELVRLLDVARRRPLVDAMTIRRGKRKGEAVADCREETRRRLERFGGNEH